MVKGQMPRTKYPKLRAWGKPTRKVMTMKIDSVKEKLRQRAKQKELLIKRLEQGNG